MVPLIVGLVRANTNNMQHDFEVAASALIEVDPYRKSQRSVGGGRTGQVSAIDYTAGRGSTGVDLRWHPKPEFKNLADDQRDELTKWTKTSDGKKHLKKNRGSSDRDKKSKQGGGNGDKKS